MSDTDAWGIYDTTQDNLQLAESKSDAEDRRNDIVALGADPGAIEVRQPGDLPAGRTVTDWCDACTAETEHEVQQNGATLVCLEHDGETPEPDGGTAGEAVDPEIVDHSPGSDTDTTDTESVATDAPAADARSTTPQTEVVGEDPIEWLEKKNGDFVNRIQGTPAISKQGFRYLQQRFGLSTESEVVETFSDPLGVIVWARAELPDGQSAEAHGEGYRSERDVDNNEVVRYADTRAKNRAISDLTSAGALAVAELLNGDDSV